MDLVASGLVLTVEHRGLLNWRRDQRDEIEWQMAQSAALAHGARIHDLGAGDQVTRRLMLYAVCACN